MANFTATEWLTLGGMVIGVVVWLVRLEGRINLIETRYTIDEKHLDEKFSDLGRTLDSIERKVDGLIPLGLAARALIRPISGLDGG